MSNQLKELFLKETTRVIDAVSEFFKSVLPLTYDFANKIRNRKKDQDKESSE